MTPHAILLTHDTVILQTTAYTRFEDFAERLRLAVHTVLAESEHDELGVVHRVGLRCSDVVRPSGGKDFRFYLRPGAAKWENMTVAALIRAAIAVRARDGYCQHVAEGAQTNQDNPDP